MALDSHLSSISNKEQDNILEGDLFLQLIVPTDTSCTDTSCTALVNRQTLSSLADCPSRLNGNKVFLAASQFAHCRLDDIKVFPAAARCKVNDIQVFLAPANPALVSSSSKHLQSASTYTGLKQFRCVADVLATEVVAPSEGTSPLENDGGDLIVRPISHANESKKQSTTSSKAPGIDSADQEGVPEYIDSADQEGDDHLHSPISEPSPNTTKKINPLANRYGEAAEGLPEAKRLSNWHIEQSRS